MKELKRSNHVHKMWKRKCATLNNFGMPYLWGLKIGLIAEISHTYHILIILAACRRFAMVRIYDNGPTENKA